MERNFEALRKRTFDLAVIGGGIHGAAVAREAALRGLTVAMIEARDFASGTSSRSSKLIHGGLRYLQQFDFRLVHEARRERRLLLKLAPHLVHPLPFLLPIYQGDPYSPLKVRLGLSVYDLLGNLGRADRHRMLKAKDVLRVVPALAPEGLRRVAMYHDSVTDDARLTLENAIDAADHCAAVVNYTEVRALDVARAGAGGSEVVSAEAEDQLTGRRHEIAARFWVNAAGPWVDHVRALLPGFDGSKSIRMTKGTHIIVPPVCGPFALFAAILPGDRIFVMLPWHGRALLGTTDTDFDGDPASVRPEKEDVMYLLAAVNRIFRPQINASEVEGAFAGLRPLVVQPGASPSANTREYKFHQDPWARNFISICGGKLTTARALAEKLVDVIQGRLGITTSGPGHPSRSEPLAGGHTGPFDVFVNYAAWEAVREFQIPHPIAERIVRTYGSRWRKVCEPVRSNPRLGETLPGSPTLIAAEVDFAMRHEMAVTVEDFLLRRSGMSWMALSSLRDAAPAVARLFAERLGWNADRVQTALEDFWRCAPSA
jgi:glycerol-3-phosphate dehydrogenase